MPYRVIFLHPTDQARYSLRRYASGECPGSPGKYSYHNATVHLEDSKNRGDTIEDSHPHDDPRWPSSCESCAYEFREDDTWQLFHESLYRLGETSELTTLRNAPIGACWNAFWMLDCTEYVGPDGRCLTVKTPGGDWIIDSRASNCDRRDDNIHKCWVRHGSPEDGSLHVDKNGNTCSAGAGSIIAGNYHGFLHNGYLTDNF